MARVEGTVLAATYLFIVFRSAGKHLAVIRNGRIQVVGHEVEYLFAMA